MHDENEIETSKVGRKSENENAKQTQYQTNIKVKYCWLVFNVGRSLTLRAYVPNGRIEMVFLGW